MIALKSIEEGTRLGARLELSRTYFEIGKRIIGKILGEGPSRIELIATRMFNGLTPYECLDKAEAMFREMGLEWDLEQLESFRNTAQ